MVPIDLQRLAKFRYAIITLIDEEGYPFSVPTDFQITPKAEILLKKPASNHTLAGKDVGVLFNHISAIPTGGYTERRYMLIWGRISELDGELQLDPKGLSEWDEKILPFDQLCAKAAPRGQKYLEGLQRPIEA